MKKKLFWSIFLLVCLVGLFSAGFCQAQGVTYPGGSVRWGADGGGVNYPGGNVTWGANRGGTNVRDVDVGVNWNSFGRGGVNINIPGVNFNTNIRW